MKKCNDTTKDVLLQVRISRDDHDRIHAECKRRGVVPSQVVRDLLHGWFNGEDRTALQTCNQDGQPAAPKQSQPESGGSEPPQHYKTETDTEAISPVPRFDWELPECPWRKPCPACGGHPPNPSSPCWTCANYGWVFGD